MTGLAFSPHGPFDREEQALVRDVLGALGADGDDDAFREAIGNHLRQLDRLGEVVAGYPSLFATHTLGSKKRDLSSLVEMLTRATSANFEMFLPVRALFSRSLVMGEMNFYRLLRMVCQEALSADACAALYPRVERRLCLALYTRLSETVLISIACDNTTALGLRDRAVLSLMHIWDDATFRVADFFPVLEATWEARRQVPVVLGTLMGTAEMFRLLEAGCDEDFVDYLVRPEHTEDEASAFREFLFGTTTEELARLEQERVARGGVVSTEGAAIADACASEGDPALALYEFFLSRHLQASARRLATLEGPKRTAEEYVMLNYLAHSVDEDRLSLPP